MTNNRRFEVEEWNNTDSANILTVIISISIAELTGNDETKKPNNIKTMTNHMSISFLSPSA